MYLLSSLLRPLIKTPRSWQEIRIKILWSFLRSLLFSSSYLSLETSCIYLICQKKKAGKRMANVLKQLK